MRRRGSLLREAPVLCCRGSHHCSCSASCFPLLRGCSARWRGTRAIRCGFPCGRMIPASRRSTGLSRFVRWAQSLLSLQSSHCSSFARSRDLEFCGVKSVNHRYELRIVYCTQFEHVDCETVRVVRNATMRCPFIVPHLTSVFLAFVCRVELNRLVIFVSRSRDRFAQE